MVTGSGEKRFHDQISWLMFLFSIFVIWVHSYNVDLFSGGAQDGVWSLADRIENFVSVGLGQIAVPGFFLLSSYLFFRNFSWDKLTGKWKSRIFSVLIPYVVWNDVTSHHGSYGEKPGCCHITQIVDEIPDYIRDQDAEYPALPFSD